MESFRALELTAGQVVMEDLDGAMAQFATGNPIPCTHSQLIYDFELVPGGQSPKLTIAAIQFRADQVAGITLRKDVKFSLKITPTADPIALKLGHGGLLPGGAMYQFMAFDANYGA